MVRFRLFENKKTGKNDINVYFYDMDEEESVLMHVFADIDEKKSVLTHVFTILAWCASPLLFKIFHGKMVV